MSVPYPKELVPKFNSKKETEVDMRFGRIIIDGRVQIVNIFVPVVRKKPSIGW